MRLVAKALVIGSQAAVWLGHVRQTKL